MSHHRPFSDTLSSVTLLITALAALGGACGGETVGSRGGSQGQTVAGTTVSGTNQVGGQTCVEVELSPSATVCKSDSDCTVGPAGQVCTSTCDCGDTPMNTAAADQIRSRVSAEIPAQGIPCPCVSAGEPTCVGGQCALCGGAGGPACGDGGVTMSEPPPESDGAEPDSGQCVFVDIATYDTSCTQATDCIMIGQGDICPGDCGNCLTAPVSASEQARYDAAIQGVTFTGICSCPASGGPPACVAGKCASCSPGDPSCGAPNPPPVDAGTGPTQGDDGGVCVDVDLASYSTECHHATDCVLIVSGELCSGSCSICGVNAAVNVSGAARYGETVAPVSSTEMCGCGTDLSAECIDGECLACGGMTSPAGCPAGGAH